jgi:hypothetical protein
MTTIKFTQQLQSKTTPEPKHQLDKSYKRKKGKKIIGVILSIIQNLTSVVQIITPILLNTYNYETIYYMVSLFCILSNISIKYKRRNV